MIETMVLYSSHCPKCVVIERLLKEKEIPFRLCDAETAYLPIAEQHGITQMPFADVDGQVVDCKGIQKMITEWEV